MKEFTFSVPQNIIVGQNTMSKLPELAKKLNGTHAMILSGPNLLKMGVVQKAVDYLGEAGIQADVFTEIEANPSVATVEKATEAFKAAGADFLVAALLWTLQRQLAWWQSTAERLQSMREPIRFPEKSFR
jgi:alcohol dehydrogenase